MVRSSTVIPNIPQALCGHRQKRAIIGGAGELVKGKSTYYEFFAGGGMARAGLGDNWKCLFANDHNRLKFSVYISNWGNDAFVLRDVHELVVNDLPGCPDLAWASFPCQDLSIAGNGL